MTFRAPPCTLH